MAKKTEQKSEKKLYGAAAAAHNGVLYGAAKKSAEERAARIAKDEKSKKGSGKKETAGSSGSASAKKETAKSASTKKATAGTTKAAPAKKEAVKSAAAKSAPAKKETAKTTKAAPAKKDVAKSATAQSGSAKKEAAKSAAAKSTPAKKEAAKATQTAAKKGTDKKPEKKLYGAAAAAHNGVLYGAAKKSAEERAAKLKSEDKKPGKKSGAKSADKPEKKLYGAAAAAHNGVLYGAAKKSAEERAAKLKSEDKRSGKKSGAGSADKPEKKLYGAAAAAHAGVLYGAAKKSAEARAAKLAEDSETEPKSRKSKKTEKAEKTVTAPSGRESKGSKESRDDRNKRLLTWEEEEMLLNGESDEGGREVDEALQQRFRKKMDELLQNAKKKKNVLEYTEIKNYLADLGLDDEHLERVLEIMESEGIDVLKTDDDVQELPADDEILSEEEEEVDMDNLDLSVPDSVSIEDPVRMYLKEIGKVPLLSADEEIVLAKRMEEGLIAEKKLRDDRTKMTKDGRKNVQDRIREYEKELAAIKGDDEEAEEERRKKQELIENSRKMLDQDKAKKKLTDKEKEALKAPIAAGEDAKNKLAEANLRLVVSIAKRYVGRGMLFLDLIQEGNLGLIKAVEKFDFRKGFKFSTYATWWIRQAITRAIADQARTIRIPVHMVETINKLIRISRQLLQELGREPTPDEIAERMGMPVDRVREILKISQEPVSLETPIGEEEDSHLGDFIQDDHVPVPADAAAFTLLKEQLVEVLGTLTEREQKVLRLRFGLDDGRARTLEEVGREFNVTRERIRQIEAKALRKLRHPSRSRKLKDYLD